MPRNWWMTRVSSKKELWTGKHSQVKAMITTDSLVEVVVITMEEADVATIVTGSFEISWL